MYLNMHAFRIKTQLKSNHLYYVDDVIGQPEDGEGRNDHQDQAAALASALEHSAF